MEFFKQEAARVEIDAIYAVTEKKEVVNYKQFSKEINEFYSAVKGNMPENILVVYKDEKDKDVVSTLKKLGEDGELLEVRAVAAVGACIFLRSNDIDSEVIREIYCLGDMPSHILDGRGDIFGKDSSGSSRIKCIRIPELVTELLRVDEKASE